MNEIVYGRIQGFLQALEHLNNEVSGQTDNCYHGFDFRYVPTTHNLESSIVSYMRQRVKEWNPTRQLDAYPKLEAIKNWEIRLGKELDAMLLFTFRPVTTGHTFIRLEKPLSCSEKFVGLLKQLGNDKAVKVWKLAWLNKQDNTQTYPLGMNAYEMEFVIEADDEIYHLSLVYGD